MKKLQLVLFASMIVMMVMGCSAFDSKDETNVQELEPQVADQSVITQDGLLQSTQSTIQNAPSALPTGTLAGTQAPVGAVAPPGGNGAVLVPPTPETMIFQDAGTNPFTDTSEDRFSTFGIDVDTASYTIARNYLVNYEQIPPADSIRPEEFINYFNPRYDSPEDNDAFAIHIEGAPSPFGEDGHYLVRVGIQGRYIEPEDREPVFLIFVIDVSGSMDMENRLELVKEALGLLVGELREDDRVGIVVYSDQSRAVLDPTPASEKDTIMEAINRLQPEGSTNVNDGLRLGYAMAHSNRDEAENTRIIVLSDGVANVGTTDAESMLDNVRDGVEEGITLSTIGFGMGNFNDVLMEQLGNDGNGNYYYVDEIREARRIFVYNLTSTLQVIAYNARIQVEFNPEVTSQFRLIGYENRAITDSEFRNDTSEEVKREAGEVGAGHSITALYEIELNDDVAADAVIGTVYLRYEEAETREVIETQKSFTSGDLLDDVTETSPAFRLQMVAAEFSEHLKGSEWAANNLGDVTAFLRPVLSEMPGDLQAEELMELVQLAVRYEDR